MFLVILSVLALIGTLFGIYKLKSYNPDLHGQPPKELILGGTVLAAVIGVGSFIGLSVVNPAPDEMLLKNRIYGCASMPVGQIIAKEGECGPQASVIMPGFKIIPFVRFLYDLEAQPNVIIPAGQYGVVFAYDGQPLREGQVIADPWPNYSDMIDAQNFLGVDTEHDDGTVTTTRVGQRGTQLTILPPAEYKINKYVFKLQLYSALQVKTGEVAVIRSNVQTAKSCDARIVVEGLNTALVPKGCKGVWNEPLYQGMHFMNAEAYIPTIISTRAQVWAYKGGYTTKKIDLTVNDDGSITQKSTPITVKQPANAADKAINVRVEGWTVPVEARITVQVSPENAAKVVAGVGTLQNVEDKITTPNIRDSLRTIGGAKKAKVLDFVSDRAAISKAVMADIKGSTEQAGVTIIDVNLGEPAIPPELLVANQRKQIAGQLKKTYQAERETQKERIKSQREKATADQQKDLVKAEIARKAAKEYKEKRRLEGEGEKLYLVQLAAGEKARKTVLGEAKVVKLKMMEMLVAHPEIVKVPHIVVQGNGGGSSLEGMAAIMGGYSNATKMFPAAK